MCFSLCTNVCLRVCLLGWAAGRRCGRVPQVCRCANPGGEAKHDSGSRSACSTHPDAVGLDAAAAAHEAHPHRAPAPLPATHLRRRASGVPSPGARSPLRASNSSMDACCACCGTCSAEPGAPPAPLPPLPLRAKRSFRLPLDHGLPPQGLPPLGGLPLAAGGGRGRAAGAGAAAALGAGSGAGAPRAGKSCGHHGSRGPQSVRLAVKAMACFCMAHARVVQVVGPPLFSSGSHSGADWLLSYAQLTNRQPHPHRKKERACSICSASHSGAACRLRTYCS